MDNRDCSITRSFRRLLILATVSLAAISLCGTALAEDPARTTEGEAIFAARPVLGLENAHSNATGSLTVQEGALRFQNNKHEIILLSITSIEDIVLSQQSKQVGGLPMTLSKAAVPYGGGRVVSLFSHKKYDDIAIVYHDGNGGIHGVIFELQAGQGSRLQKLLVNHGAQVRSQNIGVGP
jgi:hypothetical protein